MRYTFNDYELRLDTFELTGPDGRIHLEPQVFDVLAFLVKHRDRVVAKHELLDEVWESRFVSESALTSRIKDLRIAVGDSGRAQHTVRTAHGKGYQFIAEITELAGEDPQAVGEQAVVRQLPSPSNLFLGRRRELDDLADRLADTRLVTVLGPGGTGKTRLCIEHARALPESAAATFVDLAAVRDEAAVGQALAGALGIDAGAHEDVVDACCSYLRARPTLLVMDNCEHVVGPAAALVARVMDETTTATVLATSRVPLGVRDEVLFRLQPLPVLLDAEDLAADDALANAAVSLFVDRVGRVTDDFVLDDTSLPGVIALCNALDGLPLAIELAAGRMGVFGLDDLVARLDRRLDLLGDDSVGAEARHRTLRATLEWSYDLLEPHCQRLFRYLSVFPGGLSLGGVEWLGDRLQLPGDPLMVLNTLVEASLIGKVTSRSGTRYVQLETMRTYGVDLLDAAGEHDDALDALAEGTMQLAGAAEAGIMSADEVMWNDRLRREFPNIREARLHLRRTGRVDDMVDLAAGLYEWGMLRDVSELWVWADELTELDLDETQRSRAVAIQALAHWRRGRIDAGAEAARAVLEGGDADNWSRARAYSALAVTNLFKGELDAAAEAWDNRVAVEPHYYVDVMNAAMTAGYAGDIERARSVVAELRPTIEATGWTTAIAWMEYVAGEVESAAGNPECVLPLQRAVDRAAEAGSSFIVGVAGLTLCTNMQAQGDLAEAAKRYRDLIEHWLRSGTWTQQWTTLRHAASMLDDVDPALALSVLLAADADPYAPVVDSSPGTEAAAHREALAARLDDAELDRVRTARVDRSELAERVREALGHVVSVPS